MKLFLSFVLIIFISNCSFDDKTGIWNNDNPNKLKKNDLFAEFKTLSSQSDEFKEIIPLNKNYNPSFLKQKTNISWNDIFYSSTNNSINFNYLGLNNLILKSKKISSHDIMNHKLLNNNIVILATSKGDLIFYSLDNERVINKFNFYQKKFKKIPKKINFITLNDIVYVSDNLGFLYAFDYLSNKIIWAKNYKIPFRSNLKLYKNKLIAANQNNILYFFNKNNGDVLKFIPTEETIVKNQFVNSLSINENYSYFLNTYGSLYSINNKTMKIIWFINLNQSNDLNPSNLFLGNQIVNFNKKIIVTSNKFTYIINKENGVIDFKFNFSSLIKPVANNDNAYLISKNNLLICLNLKSGKILYSYNINEMISNFLKIKKKKAKFKTLVIAGDKINIFLSNSYVLKIDAAGKLTDIVKLPRKIKSFPIFSQNNLIYLDKKNKISVIN